MSKETAWHETALRMFKITGENELCDEIWWRTDGEYAPVTFIVNCNDLFFWGCSDAEIITEDNIDILEQACEDLKNSAETLGMRRWKSLASVSDLFCCRVRKMRPQNPYYEYIEKELWHLFDACGPERTDTGERK